MAELRGEGTWSIVFREILPNAANVLLVEFSLRLSYAPILIGALGFLGFGIRPPTPEWGLMISENRNLLIVSPVTVFGAGLGLASLVIGFNLFTDGLSRMLGQRPVAGA
ncbi:ABC transporter permease subunit [Ensifer sp. 4252]|uniref:ABC transporter permease subunit n=1 Tax=Ensifer sp. 4252 TaxID=3373915 RepID=UPI003D1D91C7